MEIAIGVDIGGSHIGSAAVNLDDMKIFHNTYVQEEVDNKRSKEVILNKWSSVINRTISQLNEHKILGFGLAMPGPFQYSEGIGLFERNDKYESLNNVNVKQELKNHLSIDAPIRFINDASSFGVGGILSKGIEIKRESRVIAVTLGTGFGASFLKGNIPLVKAENVPEDGCLWNKPFRDGIADDYFSTRWFLKKYQKLSGKNNIEGVKDLVKSQPFFAKIIFEEFAYNFTDFLISYLFDFNADVLVIGGSISKAQSLYLSIIKKRFINNNWDKPIIVAKNTEYSGIIGASYLFNEDFWNLIKMDLPVK